MTSAALSLACLALLFGLLATVAADTVAKVILPDIETGDVTLFCKIHDAARGHPTSNAPQHDYLGRGSDGLQRLEKLRSVAGARIAAAIARKPDMYIDAQRCLDVLPRVRTRVRAVLEKLAELYPEAHFQPITIVAGRGKPTGVTDDKGVIIGLESRCAVKWIKPDLEDALRM